MCQQRKVMQVSSPQSEPGFFLSRFLRQVHWRGSPALIRIKWRLPQADSRVFFCRRRATRAHCLNPANFIIFLRNMRFFLKIFNKNPLQRSHWAFFFFVSQLVKFRPKKTLVRTLLLFRLLLYQLFALCNFFSLHYLLRNIVHNFISHKVMARAPCWWYAPNFQKMDPMRQSLIVPVGAGPNKWVSNFNFDPLVWYNLLKRCACNTKVIPSKGLNLGFLSHEHMNCSKLDCIGQVNFGIMSQSLPLMGTTLVSNKKNHGEHFLKFGWKN